MRATNILPGRGRPSMYLADFRRLTEAGHTLVECANELGAAKATLQHLRKRYKLPINLPVRPGGPIEKKIVADVRAGFTPIEVMNRNNRSLFVIKRVVLRTLIKNA